MSFPRSHQIYALVIFCALVLALAGCGAVEQVKLAVFPTATPLPTPTPEPYTGQVGQRTAYNGWAMTVSNVTRSDLNPQQISPKEDIIDTEYDYIYMDVLV